LAVQGERTMERRHQKRLHLHIKAKIRLDDNEYDGYIENISENGIGYLLSSSFKPRDEIRVTKYFELTLEIPLDNTVSLHCEVMWINKGTFSGSTVGLGMKIIDPPQEYIDWVNKENADNESIESL